MSSFVNWLYKIDIDASSKCSKYDFLSNMLWIASECKNIVIWFLVAVWPEHTILSLSIVFYFSFLVFTSSTIFHCSLIIRHVFCIFYSKIYILLFVVWFNQISAYQLLIARSIKFGLKWNGKSSIGKPHNNFI